MPQQLDNFRLLGRSGLRVSPLALGTMTFGMKAAWGSDDAEAEKMFNHYIERGGNFIDTANFYGSGGSEQLIGKLAKSRRDQLVIATKYTLTMRPGDPNASGNQRKNMVLAVEESLRRLGTDYIDLLYLHMWDQRTPAEEVLRAFDDLVRAGKIMYVGLSDIPAWQTGRMHAIAELRGWAPIVALQILYNLTDRGVEREFLPMALALGMAVLPWSPLGGGVLAGKYSRKDMEITTSNNIADLNTRQKINLATGRLSARNLDIADVVKAVAKEMNRTPSQVALAWTLLHPAVTSPIIGARTFAQFQDNLAALEIDFTADQAARLNEASQIQLGFPYDMITSEIGVGMLGGVKVALPQGR
ncbi:MAG: aldo/keto reductase [Rhodospirillaceae bacterium]|nr:MAG: aldo/keto reductase [Rhodospirillaceae bacterium]